MQMHKVTIRRMMVSMAVLCGFLAVIRMASRPTRVKQYVELYMKKTESRTYNDLLQHANQSVSNKTIDIALKSQRLKNIYIFKSSIDPRSELQNMVEARIFNGSHGEFAIIATGEDPITTKNAAFAVAEAYVEIQGRGKVNGPFALHFDVGVGQPTLNRPWKVVSATILAILISAIILVVPIFPKREVGNALQNKKEERNGD